LKRFLIEINYSQKTAKNHACSANKPLSLSILALCPPSQQNSAMDNSGEGRSTILKSRGMGKVILLLQNVLILREYIFITLDIVWGVVYTPPPIPVRFWFVQLEFLEFLESSGLFFVCSFPYVTQFRSE
jgi:hypothetical protein